MASRWLSLTALVLVSAAALAQQPGTPPPQQPNLNPANDKLDAILVNWEKAMSSINSLHAGVTRTDINKVFGATEIYGGEAKYLKPNKASLWLQNQDPKKKQEFERLVCNGQIAYKWEPTKKQIHIYELPKPPDGQINNDNFVSMLFGMKATTAKERYKLELAPDAGSNGFYYYIMVYPKKAEDKAEFTKARLALTANTYLPRQIWFEQPNGNETTWDFNKLATNLQIDPREFNQPVPEPGWQLQRVTPETPRVRAQKQ